MKYSNLKYVVFVIASVFLVGCNGDDNQSDIAFVKFFGDGTNDHGVDLCMHNDVIYVLANAKANDENQKVSPYLYFLNKQGEFVDEPLVFDDLENDEEAQKLLIDDERNLYIVSNVKDASGNEKIHIRKIQNNISTSLGYFGDNLSEAVSVSARDAIISESEEEIAIVGKARNNSDKLNAYYLVVNLDGQLLVHNDFGFEENDEARKIVEVNNNYYFTGYTENRLPNGKSRGISLSSFRSDRSDPIYDKSPFGTLKYNEGLCITKLGNTFLIASKEERSSEDVSNLKVYQLGVNDPFDIQKSIEFNDVQNVIPTDIVTTNNGFIVVTNKFRNNTPYIIICVLYYDNDGNLINKKEFGATGEKATLLQARKAIMVNDELFIVGQNESKNYENSDIVLLKLKSHNEFYE
jgi:hypothetical protein